MILSTAIKIEEITFLNIQSLANITIRPSGGLNVLVSANQSGKSVLFKVMEAMVSNKSYSRREWKDFIRYNETAGVSIVRFSDATMAMIIITKNGPTYRFYPNAYDTDIHIEQSEPFKEVADRLGLLVDKDGTVLNIINQRTINRFIEKAATGPEIIERVVSDSEMETLMDRTAFGIDRVKGHISMTEYEMSKIKEIMSTVSYKDTSKVRDVFPYLEVGINVYSTLADIQDVVSRIDPDPDLFMDFDLAIASLEVADMVKTLLEIKYVPSDEVISAVVETNELLGAFIDVEYINEKEEQVVNSCLDVIDIIAGLSDVEFIEDNIAEELAMLEALDLLVDIRTGCKEVIQILSEIDTITQEIVELESEIMTLGKEVECPIYGKIIHAYENCIPISN